MVKEKLNFNGIDYFVTIIHNNNNNFFFIP